ncbi:MAG TPA: hypothetical protein VGI00_13485 [Streptosporangiaceae bacterium]|jgi:hypothetical protein
MADEEKEPDSVDSVLNGHKLNGKTSAIDVSWLPPFTTNTDQETTRYLSAATQPDIVFAKRVVDRVVNEQFRALPPTHGVDVPTVAMWALKSVRTRAVRDYALAFNLGVFIVFATMILIWPWFAVATVVPLIAAWLAVSWEHWECIHNVVIRKMLRNRFKLSDAPPPRLEPDRVRLQEIKKRKDGNLVVFSGHSAFIGAGLNAYQNRLILDVSRGKDDENGTPTKPKPFATHDLHQALLAAFDHADGLGKNLSNINVYERLFVNGRHIQSNSQLLPDPYRPPPTSVNSVLLQSATVHPSPEARTYVCVEMPGWQGQLVVTLFVRAVYAGGSLYVDWSFRVLPPLRQEFLRIDTFFEQPKRLQLRNSLGHGFRTALPALMKSPANAFSSFRASRKARRRSIRQADAIRKGYVFDYGARSSIREDACGMQRQHYFLARDEVMYILLAEKTLTRTVRSFLDDHGVDLSEFETQIKIIFDNSINVGSIKNSDGVVIGNNSSATTVKEQPKGNNGRQAKE